MLSWLLSDSKNKKVKMFTRAEVSLHNHIGDCYVIYQKEVYDITQFMNHHPGGSDILLKYAGKDITMVSHLFHAYVNISEILKKVKVGKLLSENESQIDQG